MKDRGEYIGILEQENAELKSKLELYENGVYFSSEIDEKDKEIDKLKEQLRTSNELNTQRILIEIKLRDENKRLRKEYQDTYKDVRIEIKEYKTQQKEFIKYLEQPIKIITDGNPTNISEYTMGKLDTLKEVLSKYKEIIGDVEDE